MRRSRRRRTVLLSIPRSALRAPRFLLVLLLAAAVGLGAAAGAGDGPGTPAMAVVGAAPVASPFAPDPGPVDDPFPIVRVRVPEARLADALGQFDPGAAVRLPRDEFELRVRKAGLAAAGARLAPRIVEATYRATLADANLAGDAEWVILNPRPEPAVLPLDPLRIALRAPTWADGSEAVVGGFGAEFPSGPGVWVPAAGRQVLKTKWSVAGTGGPGERQFEVRLPPCPAAVLDLDLPADRTPVTTAADVLLTGPLPSAGGTGRRTWRFRLGDRGRLEFGVRGPGEAAPDLALASLAARYELTPGRTTCAFEYDLRPARGSVGEWVFLLSPELQVTDAVVNNRAGWRVDPAARELRVTLRQPGAGGKVLITGVAPLPVGGRPTPLPIARPVRALVGDERVEVRVHPDLEAEALDPGDYRLADTGLGPDQGRVMTLVGSLLPAGADEPFRRPPAVRVAGAGPDFTTDEGVEWRAEAGRVHLAYRVGVRVRRGPLFRLAFRTPSGFALDRVTSTPDDGVAYAGPAPPPAAGVTVEFARPIPTGQRVELRLAFRGPVLPAGGTTRMPLPQLAPVGAAEREGWVGVCPGPGWAVTPHLSPPVPEAAEAATPAAAPADATATYLFRGREPEGELLLSAVRPVFTAAAETRLDLAADGLTAATRLTLKVAAGALPAVTVFEPGPARPGRTWKVADGSNAVVAATPVRPGGLPAAFPLLGAPWGGLASAVAARAATADGPGTYWVIRFARPVSHEIVIESAAVIPDENRDAGRALADELAAGRRTLLTVRGAAGSAARVAPPPTFGGTVPAGAPAAARGWSFDGLYLITVCARSHTLVVFGGAVTSRDGPTLALRLPAGAEVRAACAGGHWLDPGRCELAPGADEAELLLPVPAGLGPGRFEVRYRLPAGEGGIARRVRSPAPGLPDGPHPVRRWWVYPAETLAVWPFAARTGPGGADLPDLLGDPLARPNGEQAVTPYSGESVVVVPARLADSFGVGLAAVVVGLGWVGARTAGRSVGLALLAVLIGAGVAVLLGPAAWERAAWPAVVAGLPAAVAVVVARGRARAVPPPGPAAAAPDSRTRSLGLVAVALAGCLVLALGSRAQPAARDVALILPGPADAPARETVIAPRTLLRRLDAAARPPQPAAVVTAAAYDGRAEDGTARFTARFVVHSFRDGETPVGLPLADVRLERAVVDGKPAHPVAARADLYTVPVVGRGRHEVEVGFVVSIATAGAEREVRFGVPEVPDCRLGFAVPGPARQLQAVGRLGDQKAGPEKDAPRVEADLGAVRAAHLRWRQGTGGAAVVTAREGCVWDVSERGAELTACYQVRVASGSVSRFRFDLPAGLEPVRVTVRPLDATAGAGVLRDWSVGPEAGGLRPLKIELSGPTEGRLLVTLECAPRGAPTRHPALRFPRPVGMESAGGVYGLRATGVVVEGVTRVGVIDFAADALAREFGMVSDLRLGPAVPVLAFSPRPREVAELRPALRPGPDPPTAALDTTWRVGPHRADGQGAVRWTARDPVPVVEFVLPAVRVDQVRGAEVASWAQTDGRVQVWLRKPVREGAVDWAGTFAPSPPGKPPPNPLVFEPPVPGLVHARTGRNSLRVLPADGWAVRVDRDRGWQPEPSARAREWRFHAGGAAPPVRMLLYPPRGGPARGFGLVEADGPAASYRATVELALPPNRPHHLVVLAADLPPGATPALDLPPGTAAHDRPAGTGERGWDLDVPAAPAGVFRATVVVHLPVTGTVRLPAVWCGVGGGVPDPAGVVRWVGTTGGVRGFRVAGARPVSPLERDAIRVSWPGEAERLRRAGGAVWAVPDAPPALVFEGPPAVPGKPADVRPPAGQPAAPGPSVRADPAAGLPALAAAGWCAAVAGVVVLFARAPRATWPEQVGLLAALFGAVVAGGPVVGVAAYVAARAVWLAGRVAEWLSRPVPA